MTLFNIDLLFKKWEHWFLFLFWVSIYSILKEHIILIIVQYALIYFENTAFLKSWKEYFFLELDKLRNTHKKGPQVFSCLLACFEEKICVSRNLLLIIKYNWIFCFFFFLKTFMVLIPQFVSVNYIYLNSLCSRIQN